MAFSANYDFMYSVVRAPDGLFTIQDSGPVATGVDFTANKAALSAGQVLKLSDAGPGLNTFYDYVGSVTTSEGGTGYIIYNVVNQQFYMLTDTQFDFNGSSQAVGHAASTQALPVCFLAGTHIRTPAGEAKVEDLKAGDFVLTDDGRAMPVRWIGRQSVVALFAEELMLPVRIKAGALGENMPCRDLLVSHDHALFVDGILVQAGALINGSSINREYDVAKSFVYYHIELDDHSLILAEATPAETFVDNVDRARFDNWNEYEALWPNGRNVAEMPHPRAKASRQVPQELRTRLAERAGQLNAAAMVSAA